MINLDSAIRTSRVNAIKTAIDAGGAAASIKVYSGAKPATGAAITDQILLGTLSMSYPCGAISSNVLTMSAISDDLSIDHNGTASFCRIQDSTGAFVLDGDCGLSDSTAFLRLNSLNAEAGGILRITSMSITEGNA